MLNSTRSALLVRCSREEADIIRQAAKRERRTVSGFILNAVLNRIRNQQTLQQSWIRPKDGGGGSTLPH